MSSDRKGGGQMIEVARLWKRTSARGQTYLAGRMGGARVLVMARREGDGREGDFTHTLLLAPADERPAGGERQGQGQRERRRG